MAREPKKRAGDHAAARRRHIARQRLYDTIKAIRDLPEGETLVIRLHGTRYRVVADTCLDTGETGLYVHKGRICVGHGYKDDFAVISNTGHRRIDFARVFARVVEVLSDDPPKT
jgi:hypothetical protein